MLNKKKKQNTMMSKFKPRLFSDYDFKFIRVVWGLIVLPFVVLSHHCVYSLVSLFVQLSVLLLTRDKKLQGALVGLYCSLEWLGNESLSGNFHLCF